MPLNISKQHDVIDILNPESDQHLISAFNTAKSFTEIMRMLDQP